MQPCIMTQFPGINYPQTTGITCTAFFLQLVRIPWHLPIPFLICILLHFSTLSMNNNAILWQWKSLAYVNWCIKQNKKMTDNSISPYGLKVTILWLPMLFLFLSSLSTLISRHFPYRTVWIIQRSHPLPSSYFENTNLD